MEGADAAYRKQIKWRQYVKKKALARAKNLKQEEEKECTFKPKISRSSRPVSPPPAPLGGMEAHVIRQRKARESKAALDSYLERSSSKFGVPPPKPITASPVAPRSSRRQTLGGGAPSHSSSAPRMRPRMSEPTRPRVSDYGVAPWADSHHDALAETQDLEHQIQSERMVAERERSALLQEMHGSKATVGTSPGLPASSPVTTKRRKSPKSTRKLRKSPTPRRSLGRTQTQSPAPVPSLSGPKRRGGKSPRSRRRRTASPTPAMRAIAHDDSVEFRVGGEGEPVSVVHVPRLAPEFLSQLLSELSEQRHMLQTLQQGDPATDARLDALHRQMQSLQEVLQPWLLYSPPASLGATASMPALLAHASPSPHSAYSAALLQEAIRASSSGEGDPPLAVAAAAAAAPPEPAAPVVYDDPTTGLDVSSWVFVGGVLAGWAAVSLPPPTDTDARASTSLTAGDRDWTAAWVVADDDVVVAHQRGEPKGWLPLAKATLMRTPVESPVKGVAAETPSGTPIPDGDDAGNPPLTLICGNNMVQLQSGNPADGEAWTAALEQAMALARRKVAEETPSAELEAELANPALEVEGLMLKRAFAPGKRGKWLRRLCRVNMETCRLEYFDCKPLGHVRIADAAAEACGSPPPGDDDGLHLLRVADGESAMPPPEVPAGSTAALHDHGQQFDVMLVAEADRGQRDTWVTVLARLAAKNGEPGKVAAAAAGAGVASTSFAPDAGAGDAAAGKGLGRSPSRSSIPQWSAFKTRQSRATLQLIGVSEAPSTGGGGFAAAETRMADANALRCVQDFIGSHTSELLRCGASVPPAGAALSAPLPSPKGPLPTGLTRTAWKYALHKLASVSVPSVGGVDAPHLGLGELASGFAVLDTLECGEEDAITPDSFVGAIEGQRSLVLSLIARSPGVGGEALAPPTPGTAAAAGVLASMPNGTQA